MAIIFTILNSIQGIGLFFALIVMQNENKTFLIQQLKKMTGFPKKVRFRSCKNNA